MFDPPRHFALLVGVLSAPGDFAERAACRATWLRLLPPDDVLTLFVVGVSGDDALDAQVRAEAERHGDVLLLRALREDYRRLVFKSAALFDFAARRRDATFDYLLKTDDDSFVRIDRLVAQLRAVRQPRVYWGSHNAHVRRAASPTHKWYDSLWREPFYPTYALGSAYALSADLVRTLAALPVAQRPMFRVEDVATGIWLTTHVGETRLRRVHADQRQFPLIETGTSSGVCEPQMIVRRHCHTVELMQQLYDNLEKCGGTQFSIDIVFFFLSSKVKYNIYGN